MGESDECEHPRERLLPTGWQHHYQCGACGQILRARELGLNPRALGTNPVARRTNPKALGINPRALGLNPRALRHKRRRRVKAGGE
jgi:hypothetical protein